MIKSILLPVDGSTHTDAQLKYCIQMAQVFEAKVKVLSIVDIRIFEWASAMGADGFVPMIPTTAYRDESRKVLEAKAQAVLDKSASLLEQAGVEFEKEKIDGAPADIILEYSHLVDLLIMGVRGEFAKWKKNVIGATLDSVARHCNKPVLVTPQQHRTIGNVLFPYDGSEKSNKALQLVGAVAANLEIPVTILSVHQNESVSKKYLEEARTYLDPYDLKVETVTESGNPEKKIIEKTVEDGFDLIIMGAYGHSRIREAILGSTTDHVIRNADIPVLLAK